MSGFPDSGNKKMKFCKIVDQGKPESSKIFGLSNINGIEESSWKISRRFGPAAVEYSYFE